MATYNIQQGESKVIELAIYENDVPVDMSAATDIKAILFIKGIEVAKFSLTAQTGYGILEVKPAPESHIARLELTRDMSKTFPTGYITGTIVIKENDPVLNDGLVREFDMSVGQVFAGLAKNEILA